MDEERCKDCINNTADGCVLNKEPEDCGMEMPLPLMMEVGLV